MCGDNIADRDVKNTSDDDDVIEPDIDVGSYDDIAEENESIKSRDERYYRLSITIALKFYYHYRSY